MWGRSVPATMSSNRPEPLVEIPLVTELAPPQAGDELVSVSVSPAGEAVAVWASGVRRAAPGRPHASDLDRLSTHAPPGVHARPPTVEGPVTVRLTADTPAGDRRAVEVAVTVPHVTAHLLPGGRWLVVGGRAWWRESGPEHNALRFDAHGRLETSACFGDGIEHAQTTAEGRVWVGYFDEGVFGNLRWGGPGPRPIGAPGLNRFDADLALDWSFPGESGEICDCYALTTEGEDCLVCPYTDFPILRVSAEGRLARWANAAVGGAGALVTEGPQVALIGGYARDRDRLVVGTLEEREFRVDGRGRAVASGAWEVPTRMVSRDGRFHLFVDRRWHAADLDALYVAVAGGS